METNNLIGSQFEVILNFAEIKIKQVFGTLQIRNSFFYSNTQFLTVHAYELVGSLENETENEDIVTS